MMRKSFIIMCILLTVPTHGTSKNTFTWWENFLLVETLMLAGSYAATNDGVGPQHFAEGMAVWSLYTIGSKDSTTNDIEKSVTATTTLGMGVYNVSMFNEQSSNAKIFWNNMMAWQIFGLLNYGTYELFGKKFPIKYEARSDGGMLYYSLAF
jgi:hypothetical protein